MGSRRPPLWWFVTVGLVVAIIALTGLLGSGAASPTDWIAASATVAAFVAAALAAWYAAQAFRVETERETRWLDDQRQAQASLVAAWWFVQGTGVRIRNASNLPVTSVELGIYRFGLAYGPLDVGVVPPTSEPVYVTLLEEVEKWLPGSEPPESTSGWQVGIAFTDAAGQRWYRDPKGALTSGLAAWDTEPG